MSVDAKCRGGLTEQTILLRYRLEHPNEFSEQFGILGTDPLSFLGCLLLRQRCGRLEALVDSEGGESDATSIELGSHSQLRPRHSAPLRQRAEL